MTHRPVVPVLSLLSRSSYRKSVTDSDGRYSCSADFARLMLEGTHENRAKDRMFIKAWGKGYEVRVRGMNMLSVQ